MAAPKSDATLTAAVDQARAALDDVAEPGAVGQHLGAQMVAERLAAHYFDCLAPGYPGWRWMVTLARAPRQKVATICETLLVPGDDALLAPAWVPWAERLAPGDIGPGDVTPYVADDPNLEQGYEQVGDTEAAATGETDPAVDQVAIVELGLGRPRVLSAEGRATASTRWYAGASGPFAPVAVSAPARCTTCGYFMPMAGAMRQAFGVCANEWSPSDGRVVSVDHGCGAHSEADMVHAAPVPLDAPIVDELRFDVVEVERG